MKHGIQETDKSFVFYRQINKGPVKVSLRLGWIWIEEQVYKPSWCNPFKRVTETTTYTTEDARNLIASIQQLIPKQECEKGQADET